MTRINLIDPKYLSDKHLLAEYKELPRVFTLVKKYDQKDLIALEKSLPSQYTLGKGHVRFFYNKITFLRDRYFYLHQELLARRFNLNEEMYDNIQLMAYNLPACLQNDYGPTPEDVYLNMARIVHREAKYNARIKTELFGL